LTISFCISAPHTFPPKAFKFIATTKQLFTALTEVVHAHLH